MMHAYIVLAWLGFVHIKIKIYNISLSQFLRLSFQVILWNFMILVNVNANALPFAMGIGCVFMKI